MESYKIVINPQFEELRPWIEEISHGKRPEGSHEFFRVRNSLYQTTIGGVDVVVKDFRKPNLLNSFVYTRFRKSKARRSYENALALIEADFHTPTPIAYAEHKVNGLLVNSYYISSELKNSTEMRDWKKLPDLDALLPSFAKEIYRIHKTGIYNRDFTGGNILFIKNSNGEYTFYHVDLNRIEFNKHAPHFLYKMLGCVATPDYEETRRIARLYAEVARIDADEVEHNAVAELDKYLNIRKMKKKLRGK